MKRMMRMRWLGSTMSLLAVLASSPVVAQVFNDKPLNEKWWPSEFGPDDKAGAINRITPATVIRTMRLVKQGKTATLGKYYDRDIPAFGARTWNMIIPGTPTGGPMGSNGLVYHDEYVSTEIGQIGTQFDGPGHIGVRTSKGDLFYNGRERERPPTSVAAARVRSAWVISASSMSPRRRSCAAEFSSTRPGIVA